MADDADLTFEELDRVVQNAHTRKRKKSKTSKKTTSKSHSKTHKTKSKPEPKAEKSEPKTETKDAKSTHRKKVSRSRSVARSARAMHAKQSAASKRRVRREASHKKAETPIKTKSSEPKTSSVTVKSVPAKKVKHPKPHTKHHKRPVKTPDAVIKGRSRKLKPAPDAKVKPLITDTPPMFNRIGVDTTKRQASEVRVQVGRPSAKPPENSRLLNNLSQEKSTLPPHRPVGHVSSKSVESSLTDLYDDSKANVDEEVRAEAMEAEYKAEHQPSASSDNDSDEISLGVHSSDHHRVQSRKGWVTTFDHILNIVITTLFLVLVAFFIIVQLGWFDIGLEPVF